MNRAFHRRSILFLLGFLSCGATYMVIAGESEPKKPQGKGAWTSIAVDGAKLLLAPYVWHRTGAGPTARAEATMPGAYIKLAVDGAHPSVLGNAMLGAMIAAEAQKVLSRQDRPAVK